MMLIEKIRSVAPVIVTVTMGCLVLLLSAPREAEAAISIVAVASSSATSMTLPTHIAGDVFVMSAYRLASALPTTPTGWTNIQTTAGGGASSVRTAWIRATNSSTASGTWTNATGLIVIQLRGVMATGTPVGGSAQSTAGSGTTCTYSNITLSRSDGSSVIFRVGTRARADTLLATNLTPMFSYLTQSTSTPLAAISYMTAATATPASASPTCGSITSQYQTSTFEVLADLGRRIRIFEGRTVYIQGGTIRIYGGRQ